MTDLTGVQMDLNQSRQWRNVKNNTDNTESLVYVTAGEYDNSVGCFIYNDVNVYFNFYPFGSRNTVKIMKLKRLSWI